MDAETAYDLTSVRPACAGFFLSETTTVERPSERDVSTPAALTLATLVSPLTHWNDPLPPLTCE